jgi:hypothetical protein
MSKDKLVRVARRTGRTSFGGAGAFWVGRGGKLQAPTSKLQRSSKDQAPNPWSDAHSNMRMPFYFL